MLYKKYHKNILFTLGALLLMVSVYVHSEHNYLIYRMLRAGVSFAFLGYMGFIHRTRTSMLLAVFFVLFGSSSLLSIWYELPKVPEIMLGLNFLSYMTLILYLKPKLTKKKMTTKYWVVFLILISINVYLLYALIEMIKSVEGVRAAVAFMIVSSIGMVLLGMMTLLYNFTQSTTASLIFTVAICALIFAEVFRAIAYYDIAYGDLAVYIARFLLILSNALLIHYTIVNDKEKTPRIKQFV